MSPRVDWEAIADRGLNGEPLLLAPQDETGAKLKPSCEEREVVVNPNRRGRGSFLYQKSCLYSEQLETLTADDSRRIAKGEVVEARKGDGDASRKRECNITQGFSPMCGSY